MSQKTLPALIWIFAIIGLLVLIVDQVSKTLALQFLVPGGAVIPLVGNWLGLQLVHNPGAAFSIAANHTWVFSVLAVLVLGIIAWTGRQMTNRWWICAFGLLVGGAVGNLVDRIIQPPAPFRGRVVDFLNYHDLFVGNVADIAIVLGVGIVVVLTALGVPGRAIPPRGRGRHAGGTVSVVETVTADEGGINSDSDTDLRVDTGTVGADRETADRVDGDLKNV